MNQRYFMPFGHLQGNEECKTRFGEHRSVRNRVMRDGDGQRWRIVNEQWWKDLHVPRSDQTREGTPCRYVAVCDVVMARKQVDQARNHAQEFMGDVVGDKLSACHLHLICHGGNGEAVSQFLQHTPITTCNEFNFKCIANRTPPNDVELNDVTGCTAHRISGYNKIWRDYRANPMFNEHRRARFDELCVYLRDVGPFYASIHMVGSKKELLAP